MNEKLHAAISAIEKEGDKFSKSITEDDELYETYEFEAYRIVLEYVLSEDLKFGHYDWNEIKSDYEIEGLWKIIDNLYEMHMNFSGDTEETDGNYPVEIAALFHAMDMAFHYSE